MSARDLLMAAAGVTRSRPTFVAAGLRSSGGPSGAVSIAKPTGLATGDLMVALLSTPSATNGSWNTASGWTEVLDYATRPGLGIQWKVADSTDVSVSGFSFQAGNTLSSNTGVILAYRGAAFDVVGTGTNSSTTTIAASSITSSSTNSVLIAFVMCASSATALAIKPAIMVQRASVTSNGSLYALSEDIEDGSTGARNFGFANNPNSAVLLSMRPA